MRLNCSHISCFSKKSCSAEKKVYFSFCVIAGCMERVVKLLNQKVVWSSGILLKLNAFVSSCGCWNDIILIYNYTNNIKYNHKFWRKWAKIMEEILFNHCKINNIRKYLFSQIPSMTVHSSHSFCVNNIF